MRCSHSAHLSWRHAVPDRQRGTSDAAISSPTALPVHSNRLHRSCHPGLPIRSRQLGKRIPPRRAPEELPATIQPPSATGIVSLSATARRPGSPFTHPPAGRWTGFILCRPNQQRGRRPVSVARQARPAAHAATSVRGLPHQSDQRLGSGHRLGWWHRLRSRDGLGRWHRLGSGYRFGGGTGSGRRTALRGHDRDWGSCRRPGLRSSSRSPVVPSGIAIRAQRARQSSSQPVWL